MSVGRLALSNAIPLTPQPLKMDDAAVARLREAQQRFAAAQAIESNYPALHAQSRAVQADAVIRLNGHITGIVWKDGTTESMGEIPSFSDFANSLGNVSTQQALDAYTQKLEQTYGGRVTVERYDGSSNAPTRGITRTGSSSRRPITRSAAASPSRSRLDWCARKARRRDERASS